MSGHNKWSSIKHKKGAADAKRGKVFTKISKELTVAVRMGGSDPSGNARLRLAIANARSVSMPSDTMTRAIKKGTGELEGGQLDELVYEAYGPGGVAFIMDITTDNANRTVSEIRNLIDKSGGKFAKSGSVAFMFARRGVIRFEPGKATEERVMEAAIEAGADDVVTEDGSVVVYTAHTSLNAVKEALEAAGLEPSIAEITMTPSTTVVCDIDLARKTVKLIDKLEDHDDVQNVWANFEISDEVMEALKDYTGSHGP